MSDQIGPAELGLRMVLAMTGAAWIGWDRERKHRPAGLRTHMLVALGACLFTLLGLDLHLRIGDPSARAESMRIIAGVVGGIGFLGAGAIMQSRRTVRGLTTAAGIWVVAAIGVAAAVGSYLLLTFGVVLAWGTLTLLGRLERAIGGANAPPGSRNRHRKP